MNHVSITLTGPIMENLCKVEVSDDFAHALVHLDQADVDLAREEGPSSLLDLVVETIDDDGIDILRAAVNNGSPVNMDGIELSTDQLKAALASDGPGPA